MVGAQNLNGDQLKALSPDVLKQMDGVLPAGAEKTKVEQALGLLPPSVAGSSYTPGAQNGSASTTKIAVYGTPNGSGPGSGVYYTTDDALSIGGICVKDPFNTPGYVPLDPNNRHSSLARPASAQEYANFKSLYPS